MENVLDELKKKIDFLYEQQSKKDEFGPDHIFKTSEVAKMTSAQFDRHWQEIKRQMDAGKIIVDS